MLKKIILIFLFFPLVVQSQTDFVSLRAGGSLSNLVGSDAGNAEFRPGFHLGATSTTKIKRNTFLQMSLLFNQLNYGSTETGIDTKTKFNFFQLPISIKQYLNENIAIYAGGQLDALIFARAKIDNESDSVTDLFQTGSLGVNAGVSYELNKFIFMGNYYYGITDLIKGSDPDWHLTSIELSIGYKILDKL